MSKTISIKEAEKVFKEKYDKGKVGRHISLCDDLYYDYKDFCYNELNREPVSKRIQTVIIKDMLENSKELIK